MNLPEALRQAPTSHGLRGDYGAMRPDWTVDQPPNYLPEQHALWRTLYRRQSALVAQFAAPVFVQSLAAMQCDDGVPSFAAISRRLKAATGWEVIPVPGLLPSDIFFGHLAERRFPASWWLREPAELDYLVEPDVFHDVFGHVPLLFDPVFADYMQAYGAAGPKAIAHTAVDILSRLYWYMVEFGLIRVDGAVKAYGAGLLSSFAETKYAVESREPNRIGYRLERVLRTRYIIDRYQSTYFVLDDFEQLFRSSIDTDFAPLYEAIKTETPYPPEKVLPDDPVVSLGGG